MSCERGTAWGVSFLLSLFGKYSDSPVVRSIGIDLNPDSEFSTDKRRKMTSRNQLQDTSISSLHIARPTTPNPPFEETNPSTST